MDSLNLNFTINGKNSKNDFNLTIISSNHENISKKRYESKVIPGRTGNLIIEGKAKDNKFIDIECFTKLGTTNPQVYGIALADWLQGFEGYSQLIFDDGYQFKAILSSEIEIERLKCSFRKINFQFEVVPVLPGDKDYVIATQDDKVVLTDDTKGIEVVL